MAPAKSVNPSHQNATLQTIHTSRARPGDIQAIGANMRLMVGGWML
jgi:hypothetical protein